MAADPQSLMSLSVDGLDLSEVAVVGPCQHELPLQVAIGAATATTTTTTGGGGGTATASTSSLQDSKKKRGALMTGCPKCRTMIATATAGAGAAAATAATIIQSVTDGLASKGRPHVTFKYKNCLYSLGIVGDKPASEPATTAQGRIVKVLGLTSLKVLSRGKVVYPHKTMTEEQVSQLLLQISRSDRSAAGSGASHAPANKVSLLVMGTVSGHELTEPQTSAKDKSSNNKGDHGSGAAASSSSMAWWWNVAVAWTGFLAQQAVGIAHSVLVTALAIAQAGISAARDLFYLTAATTAAASNTTNAGAPPPRPPATPGRPSRP
jgi:hypothetical protein